MSERGLRKTLYEIIGLFIHTEPTGCLNGGLKREGNIVMLQGHCQLVYED
jgi:hypothetical protein